MSNKEYSKFIENDVYLLKNSLGLFCCACLLLENMDSSGYVSRNTEDMVEHLKEHYSAGHKLPSNIFSRLWEDDKENFGES